jgi:hypothetical protein
MDRDVVVTLAFWFIVLLLYFFLPVILTATKRYQGYLSYVLRHKWFVLLEGRKLGVPIWHLILHDWSKLFPLEFFSYAKTFRTTDGKKQYEPHLAFWIAVNSHVTRHKHHWQYWIHIKGKDDLMILPMPDRHRREMLADWYAAGLAHGEPDTRGWYMKNSDNIILHDETRHWIEIQLHATGNFDPMLMCPNCDIGSLACEWSIVYSQERCKYPDDIGKATCPECGKRLNKKEVASSLI